MNYYKTYFLFLLTFSSCLLNGQEEDYNIRYFTTEDGLSHNVVRSVLQDKKGFIWVGTDLGLNRFDGQEFKDFTKRKNGLASNTIGKIWEDRQGELWLNFNANHFIDNSMLSIFNIETEQSLFFEEYFNDVPFQKEDILIINSDEEKNIWIVTKEGSLYRYHNKFELIAKNETFKEATALEVFDKNDIWLGVGRDLINLNNEGKKIRIIETSSARIVRFGKSPQQKIWVDLNEVPSTNPSLEIFDLEENRTSYKTNYELSGSPRWLETIQFIDEDKNFKFWHLGLNSLFSTDINGELIQDFHQKVEKQFPSLYVEDILFDKFKNIWIATSSGLFLFSPRNNFFQTFLVEKNSAKFPIGVRGLEEIDDNNILVATYKGFHLVDKTTGNFSILPTVDWLKKEKGFGLGMMSIGDSIFCGNHGINYWVIDKKTKKFNLNFLDVPKRFEVKSFFQDQFKKIWVCSTLGPFLLDLKSKKVHRPPLAELDNELYQGNINSIFENDDELLISTEKGLFAINHQGAIIEDFNYLSNFQINYLHKTSPDNYWLATKGNGLILWNRKDKSIRQFTKEQGLSHDYIYSIHEDEFGFFWLPSNYGLMRFAPKDFSVNTFSLNDGIAHNEFNTHSFLEGKDGQLYFGGLNGITAFYPKDFQSLKKRNLPLKVTSIKKLIEGDIHFKDFDSSIKNPKEIYFNRKDKAISLEFCLFDYPNSFESKYAYKIEGYENDWKHLKGNQLIINKLPFGQYNLKVKAQGSHGTWSNQKITIPLYVIKPFYLTWTFLGLITLALGGLIYVLFRWRFIQLEKRNLALESIVADRTKELANLNELKDQFFAIIAHDMRGLVLSFKNISQKVKFLQRKGRANEVDSFLQGVDKSAESLSYLLDNLLNWALVEKGVFPHNPELFNVEKLVIENIKLFTQLSRIKEVKLSYEVPETLNLFADKNAISTIIRNLLNNAIKFSTSGNEVIIHAYKKNGRVQIQIKDTGVGIATAKLKNIFELDSEKRNQGTGGEKGTGIGLLLCKELVILNKGDIRIESEEGKGTRVLIGFPLVV